MFRKNLTLLLAGLLINFAGLNPAYASSSNTDLLAQQNQEEESKKKVVEWGTNKSVSVKLKSGEKIEGRIAEIKDETFSVQMVSKGKVTSQDVRYSEIKSLKEKHGKAGRVVGYTALGILAGIGVAWLVVAALIAAND